MAENKLDVTNELVDAVAVKVSDRIEKESTNEKGIPEFSDIKLQDKYEKTQNIWMNNGYESPRDQFDPRKKDQKIGYKDLVDALSTPDASILIGRVVSNVVKEAMEPLLVGTSLLHNIRFSAGQQITFPAAGAFTAEDIPEGGEYPERKLEVAGTVNIVAVFKSHLIDLETQKWATGANRKDAERLNDGTLNFSDAIVRTVWRHTESGRNDQII